MPKTELDLDALEAVAKAATQGEWENRDFQIVGPDGCSLTEIVTASSTGLEWSAIREYEDAEHIAAFDPPTALALIARIRELKSALRRIADFPDDEPWYEADHLQQIARDALNEP